MNNFFSPDSKLNQVLTFISDLFLLNLIYVICCIPIFTIGAAQTGLYHAVNILQDQNDDRSCVKEFFKSFCSGFVRVNSVYTLFLLADCMLLYVVLMAWSYAYSGRLIHWGIAAVILAILLIWHAQIPLFHSKFCCTWRQLIRNCFLLVLFHPLRSIGIGIISWLPMLLYLFVPNLFLRISPLFLTLYFSLGFMFGTVVMIKPFEQIISGMGSDVDDAELTQKQVGESS